MHHRPEPDDRAGDALPRPRTAFDKLWDAHWVAQTPDGRAIIFIDRHLVHDLSSPQAFAGLAQNGRVVRSPERTYAIADHVVSTEAGRSEETVQGGREMIVALRQNAARFGIRHYGIGDPEQGIVHVTAPDLGLILPGMTVVCGDSHTCTLGALGAWAWGIGTSEVEHVLATQTLVMHRPRSMRLTLNGQLQRGLSAKDLALYVLRRIGVQGAAAGFVELAGTAVRQLPVEGRMTLCNLGIESGARAAFIAPDACTVDYLRTRAPDLVRDTHAVEQLLSVFSDEGAVYDVEKTLDVDVDSPQFTWGTNPAQVIGVHERIPALDTAAGEKAVQAARRAYEYMGLEPGAPLAGLAVQHVFIGSCTNGRLSDLREAAGVVKGRKVHPQVRALVVPGSQRVKRQAEEAGLARIFIEAGFEWRESGCSMCVGMNADRIPAGDRCVSTSNRNFEGRQGPGARTHLASPASAAAAAIAGAIVDPREFL
ncbi:3-isopropylmalate dehydratase large subunit [Bordetella petrii]|uniref:3-isopropylmalate dehydratase large subunit n=1 Tax=Bordetella petrii TaxID=94624 RepID=UPI0004AF9A69|nr:3-isopropylmalate dehydratase large subunit [Bordetella petrii]